MRRILAGLLLLCVWGVAGASPPNVVLIIGDDQGWEDFGFMGHEIIKTPHLDKLAAEGMVYERGYVVSSLCRPSLATLATGLYPHEHGITGNDPPRTGEPRPELNAAWLAQFKTLPRVAQLLGEAGYVSHQSGKWWEGPCLCGGFTEGMTHGDPERGGRHGDVGLEIGREGMKPVTDFIDSAGDQPFFVWYAPFLPHTPHNPPDRLLEPYLSDAYPREMALYYAMCTWFDETVGTLLDHLDAAGKRENTLVIFLGDNGWIQPTPERPAAERASQGAPRGKGSAYDGGLRTPVVLHWPGKTDNKRSMELVSSIDIVPTILAAAGVEIPADLRGLNLLHEEEVAARDAIFGAIFEHDMVAVDQPEASLQWRYVVSGEHKLIAPTPLVPGGPELFHITADPWEHTNLYDTEEDLAAQIFERLNGWWNPKVEAPTAE